MDEVAVLVAIVDDGVHGAHRVLTGIEIEPHDKGEPAAAARLRPVLALDLHHDADWTGLLHSRFLHAAKVPGACRRVGRAAVGTVLKDADEAGLAGDDAAVHPERVDEVVA